MKETSKIRAQDVPWIKKEHKHQNHNRKQTRQLLTVTVYDWRSIWPHKGADIPEGTTAKRFLLSFRQPVKYSKVMNVLNRAFGNESLKRLQ